MWDLSHNAKRKGLWLSGNILSAWGYCPALRKAHRTHMEQKEFPTSEVVRTNNGGLIKDWLFTLHVISTKILWGDQQTLSTKDTKMKDHIS